MMRVLTEKSEGLDEDDLTEKMDCANDCSTTLSLIDSTACALAKQYSASELRDLRPALDKEMLRKVVYWSFPQDTRCIKLHLYMSDGLTTWKRAKKLVEDKSIKEMLQVGFITTAYLNERIQVKNELRETTKEVDREVKVSLVAEKQRILTATCSVCLCRFWCVHIIAAIIQRIKYPEKVTVHAPLTEALSSLNRDQLQKLIQYTVNMNPSSILGQIFMHFDEIRGGAQSEQDKVDEMAELKDAEVTQTIDRRDRTYMGLMKGERSHLSVSLDKLGDRILSDVSKMICIATYYSTSYGPSRLEYFNKLSEYYMDGYDMTLKKDTKLFSYITLVVKLLIEKQYICAARVMQKLITITSQKMREITRSDCPSLSRWWHDLSHIHALLVLRTEDKEARSVLLSTANKINANEAMKEHILQTSDWSELSSITLLFPTDTDRLSTEGCMMVESVLANQLQPNPQHLQRLLDDTENINYNEDMIVMLARLESLFLFEKDQCAEKISRLGFLILHKLSLLAQKDSVIGQYIGSVVDRGLSGAPFSLTQPVTSASSCEEPMDIDSQSSLGDGDRTNQDPKDKHSDKTATSATRMGEEQEQVFTWSTVGSLSSHIAHAMLHTLHIIIKSQTSALDSANRKGLVGFCLQALELSRHRLQAVVNTISNSSPDQSESVVISQLEYDWCEKLETAVCDYLRLVETDECQEAVCMYIDCMSDVGMSFYSNAQNDTNNNGSAYPLILLEMLCEMCVRDNALKESKSRQLVKICSEVLLGSLSCRVYNKLMKEDVSLKLMIKSLNKSNVIDFEIEKSRLNFEKSCISYAVKTFCVIIETFVSLVGSDSSGNVDLFTSVLKHLESIHNVALLKLIWKDVRAHFQRCEVDRRVVESMLQFSMHTCQKILRVPESSTTRPSSPSLSVDSQIAASRYISKVEKNFVASLKEKLGTFNSN